MNDDVQEAADDRAEREREVRKELKQALRW